jgi:hypothetical protein
MSRPNETNHGYLMRNNGKRSETDRDFSGTINVEGVQHFISQSGCDSQKQALGRDQEVGRWCPAPFPIAARSDPQYAAAHPYSE